MLRNLIKSNQKFIKHNIFSYSVIIFNIISSIIAVKHNLHILNKEVYGLWIISFSIISILGLLNLGFNSVLIFQFESYKKKNDLNLFFSSNIFVAIFQLFITSLFFIVIFFFLSKYIVSTKNLVDFKLLLLIMIPGLFLSIISSYFESILYYNLRFIYFKNLLELLRLGVLNVGFIIGLFFWPNVKVLGIVYSCLSFVILIYTFYKFKKNQVFIIEYSKINVEYFKSNFKNAISFWILSFSSFIITQTDTLFITSIKKDLGLVTIYSQSFRLQDIALKFIKKITEIKGPKILILYNNGNHSGIINIYKQLFSLSLGLSLLSFILICLFGKPLLEFWLNYEIIFDQQLIIVLSLLCISGSLHWVIWNFANITEQQRKFKNISLLEIFLNLVLSYILLQKIGLIGLGIASLISNSFTIIYGIVLFKKYETKWKNINQTI